MKHMKGAKADGWGVVQTLADETEEEDSEAIHLDHEDESEDGAGGDEVAGGQLQRRPGRKPQPSSVKLESRKAAQAEQAARLALKQQRRDIENLPGD